MRIVSLLPLKVIFTIPTRPFALSVSSSGRSVIVPPW
jgi:hypothetical protein